MYTKRGGSLTATSFGVNLHIFYSVVSDKTIYEAIRIICLGPQNKKGVFFIFPVTHYGF